jgi:hypothetical protein
MHHKDILVLAGGMACGKQRFCGKWHTISLACMERED